MKNIKQKINNVIRKEKLRRTLITQKKLIDFPKNKRKSHKKQNAHFFSEPIAVMGNIQVYFSKRLKVLDLMDLNQSKIMELISLLLDF